VLSCDVGWLKPEPAILEAALERLGTRPEQALLVDDLPTNLHAAASLGMRTALMARPGGRSVPPRDGTAPPEGGSHTRIAGLAEVWKLLG
jgi:FMN phosphatase YigB (HAD superfamily)